MHRSWLLVLGFLLSSALGFGQSASSDSQGMQALVAEVRQLRKDLQTTNGYALKAQILLHRFQVQEATVARTSQHLNDLRSQVAVVQDHRRWLMAFLKENEELIDRGEITPAQRKKLKNGLPGTNQKSKAWLPRNRQSKLLK